MDIEKTVSSMTLKEKIAFCTGADFWNTKDIARLSVPSFRMADGPHGLRCQIKDSDMLGINESYAATCFPTAVTAGATWNRELYFEEGKAIAKEARAVGVSMLLGPGCNIKRSPLGGRNFEYISEDPYLSGYMAAEFVKGVQSEGVAACLKHFAANNQEFKRQISDSIADERTLREIYLRPFEIAVREGKPYAVMSSYNKINGVYASDNKWLLTSVLRDEWGFDGVVVTDWGGMNNRIAAFEAGCDLTMPGGSKYMHRATYKAVRSGKLDEKYIDESVKRILKAAERGALLDKEEVDLDAHHSLARSIAIQGAVLLKNDGNLLPLGEERVALIGRMAKYPRYQGIGSSHINPSRVVSMADAMPECECIPCGDELGVITEEEMLKAIEAAKRSEAAILAIGLPETYEAEAIDRKHMKLPEDYSALVDAVASVNKNTVVVLFGGGAMELPWINKVRAVLYMGLPGQAGGEAAADLIFGRACPSGRLTESWPYRYEDTVLGDTFGKKDAEYREGIYVGYRYYSKSGIPVAYPFGHGLTYTSFEYSDMTVDGMSLSLTVKNTGTRDGAEIVQLYVSPPHIGRYRAKKELCGFERVALAAGESKRVSFKIDERSLSFWCDGWRIEDGEYLFEAGSSSEDLRLSKSIHIEGDAQTDELSCKGWYSSPDARPQKEEWEALLGHKVMAEGKKKKRDFTQSSTIGEMREASIFMKLVAFAAEAALAAKFRSKASSTYQMMLTSVLECPIRSMEICSGGLMSGALSRLIVLIAKLI